MSDKALLKALLDEVVRLQREVKASRKDPAETWVLGLTSLVLFSIVLLAFTGGAS